MNSNKTMSNKKSSSPDQALDKAPDKAKGKALSKDARKDASKPADNLMQERTSYGRGENECRGRARMLRTSPQKLNDVAKSIRLKPVERAMQELRFSKRRIAGSVLKLLRSVIANAENNKQLDVDRLIVKEAWVGKTTRMRRFRPRAKGRAAPIIKDFSAITIIVEEKNEKV